jgi:hypothetical protein
MEIEMKFFKFILAFFVFCSTNIIIGQSFTSFPLITIPGNNYDFYILSSSEANTSEATYICWINYNNPDYTVYLKEIAPSDGEIIIVSKDSIIKSNPQISINRYSQGIKISWQNYSDNYWQILYRNFLNDSLNTSKFIADSIQNDPQISMNIHRIAWIDGGILSLKEFYPELGETLIIDSIGCSSPCLANEDFLTSSQILYEKGSIGSKQIYLAEFNRYLSENWYLSQFTQGNNSINPGYGLLNEIAFQSYYNEVWKIIYTKFSTESMNTTNNCNFNYKNPIVFTYQIPTSSTNNGTPFFLAFDTDSAENNSNNIFIQIFGYGIDDSLISISNVSGNNYNPDIAYLNYVDSSYISIIWIRENNKKKDIWIAKDKFVPILSNIDEEFNNLSRLSLKQNYPNPFNPTTTIEYYLEKPNFVSIKVYNLLGEEIVRLVEEFKTAGRHKISFDGNKYPSGIYFYELRAGYSNISKSMLLLR